MNVLVVPEDFRKDQYILKPIIGALLAFAGHARAKVQVCTDPLIGGISEALKWEVLEPILDRYRWHVDLFLLCVDRDGAETRAAALRALELKAQAKLGAGRHFLAENAWEELEVWVLAGHTNLPKSWNWKTIRAERDPKSATFYRSQRSVAAATILLKVAGLSRSKPQRDTNASVSFARRMCAISRSALRQCFAPKNAGEAGSPRTTRRKLLTPARASPTAARRAKVRPGPTRRRRSGRR